MPKETAIQADQAVHAIQAIQPIRHWSRRAACRNEDPEIFFPMNPTPTAMQLAAARRICDPCPVREQCMSYAVTTGQSGIWAGTTDDERRALRAETLKGGTRCPA